LTTLSRATDTKRQSRYNIKSNMVSSNCTYLEYVNVKDMQNSTDAKPIECLRTFGDQYLVLITLFIIALAIIILLLVECTRKEKYCEYVTHNGIVLSIPVSANIDDYDRRDEEILAIMYGK